jgi:hypothetical protein
MRLIDFAAEEFNAEGAEKMQRVDFSAFLGVFCG